MPRPKPRKPRVITWRIYAVHPKQAPGSDDCVFLARAVLPSEAFAQARKTLAVARLERRGLLLYARGCTVGTCSTRWVDSLEASQGVAAVTFTKSWHYHRPKADHVAITAVVKEKRSLGGEPRGFDGSVLSSHPKGESPIVVCDIPDEMEAMEWCEKQAEDLIIQLYKEQK